MRALARIRQVPHPYVAEGKEGGVQAVQEAFYQQLLTAGGLPEAGPIPAAADAVAAPVDGAQSTGTTRREAAAVARRPPSRSRRLRRRTWASICSIKPYSAL